MPVFDENDSGMGNMDGFPNFPPRKGKPEEQGVKGKAGAVMKKIPVVTVILIVLIVLVGIMTFSVAARISTLSAEIEETKGIKTQIGGLQATLDAKIEALNKERDRLKSEVAQLHSDIDAMRAQQRHQAEAAAARMKQAAAAEARKKSVPATKKVGPKERRP